MSKIRKLLAFIMVLALVLSISPAAFAEDERQQAAMDRWTENGVLDGVEGEAEDTISRGDSAILFANLLGLTETGDLSGFGDVSATAPYYEAMQKCYAAGIFIGNGDGTMTPEQPLNREQFFTVFGRALGIPEAETAAVTFADSGDIAEWAVGFMNEMINRGFILGMGDGTVAPEGEMTVGNLAYLLDQTIGAYANEPGQTVEGTGDGRLTVIAAPNVTATGDLGDVVIAEGTGDSSVTLKDAKADSVQMSTGASLTLQGETAVESIVISDAADGASVSVGADATVGSVDNAAEDAAVTGDGQVGAVTSTEEIDVDTPNTGVTVEKTETKADGTVVTVTDTYATDKEGKAGDTTRVTETTEPDGTTTTETETIPAEEPAKPDTGGSTGSGGGSVVDPTPATVRVTGVSIQEDPDNGIVWGTFYSVDENGEEQTEKRLMLPADTVDKGKTFQLTATVTPSGATNKRVTWESDATDVATVSSSGLVTIQGAAGWAEITVKTADGGYTDSLWVIVSTMYDLTFVNPDYDETFVARAGGWVMDDPSDPDCDWYGFTVPEGKVFKGWDLNGKGTILAVGDRFNPTEDTTFYAVWGDPEPGTVAVTGVTLNKTSLALTVDENETLVATVAPDDATEKGVTWSSSDEAIAGVDSSGEVHASGVGTATITVTTKDGGFTASCTVTVTAATPETTYSVTYDGNGATGGTAPVDDTAFKPGDEVIVMGNTGSLVKTNFKFAGWNTKADGSGTAYAAGAKFAMGEANVTLYAQWTPVVCTVTFDAHGGAFGSGTTLEVPVNQGDPVTAPTDPTHGNAAMVFDAWFTTDDASDPSAVKWNFSDPVTGDMTLYANWIMTYTVTYDGNGETGGTVPVDDTRFKPGDEVVVMGNTGSLIRATYQFVDWNTKADGSGTPYDADDTFAMGDADVTLYAQWAPVAVTGLTLDIDAALLDGGVLILQVGDDQPLNTYVTITPDDAYNKDVTWSSNNTGVATVDASGQVHAVDAGTATITVQSDEGGVLPATCDVRVADVVIRNATQLAAFAADVNGGESYAGKTVLLAADINLGGADWTPIGTKDAPFSGLFDGQGHTISNFTVSGVQNYAALFGYVQGTANAQYTAFTDIWQGNALVDTKIADSNYTAILTNVTISGANCTSTKKYAAALVAFANNCYIADVEISGCTISTGKVAGGVAGTLNGSVIRDCVVDSATSVAATSYHAGGVVGYISYYNDASQYPDPLMPSAIISCVNDSDIACLNAGGNGGAYGGIVAGINTGGATSAVIDCENNGDITIDNSTAGSQYSSQVGGIAGMGQGVSVIADCTNNGAISVISNAASNNIGGIVGGTVGNTSTELLGLYGCENTGDVSLVTTQNVNYVAGIAASICPTTTDSVFIDDCSSSGAVSCETSGHEARGYVSTIVAEVYTNGKTLIYRNMAFADLAELSAALPKYVEGGSGGYQAKIRVDSSVTVADNSGMLELGFVRRFEGYDGLCTQFRFAGETPGTSGSTRSAYVDIPNAKLVIAGSETFTTSILALMADGMGVINAGTYRGGLELFGANVVVANTGTFEANNGNLISLHGGSGTVDNSAGAFGAGFGGVRLSAAGTYTVIGAAPSVADGLAKTQNGDEYTVTTA